MGAGERLPTAEELAELYDEWQLNELVTLAGDVGEHAAREVLQEARRTKMRARLAAALNVPVVLEERQRQYALKLQVEQEYAEARAAMQQAGALTCGRAAGYAPASAGVAQSVAPSE